MRVIAFYLPQFYEFPENDKWWGEGFTEWTNVRKAKPLYKGHYQPVVPLDKNYYSLENIETIEWQVELAKKYNIFGFCFYHYWFGEGRQLMEKPVDNFLFHKEIDFPFCLSWANHNWTRTWMGDDKEILIDVKYGDKEEWENHFQYLLPFFKDNRYIRIDGKPVFVIYKPGQIINCIQMMDYFFSRALDEGLNGLVFVSQSYLYSDEKEISNKIDYKIQYEPDFSRIKAGENILSLPFIGPERFFDCTVNVLKRKINKLFHGKIFSCFPYSYDALWKYKLRVKNHDPKAIAGAFTNRDDTPRRQGEALIIRGSTPKRFHKYMTKLANKIKDEYSTDFLFLSAWNEWGEGMYLEPDEKNRYGYLEALKAVVLSDYMNDNS